MSITDEAAFETVVCEELVSHGGYARWKQGGHDYDHALGLDTGELMRFIRSTQADEWRELEHRHGSATKAEQSFLTRLTKALDTQGSVQVLRHGVSDLGVTIRLAYFRPAHSLTPALQARYAANRLTVTRQLPLTPGQAAKVVDLCLFVNGIPVATAELKNHLTGQTIEDAKHQYRHDRDPNDVTLRRAVVHFAADTETVAMTTHLAGPATSFLPFNRGHDLGAGNPPNPDGHRTAYLWRQVWEREAWLDLLARFVHTVDPPTGTREPRRTIFPRYHQWDAVRRLEAHARAHGPGERYLVQHSAGSGKSNTIAWLAHRLSTLHGADDRPVFDKVIVITDRVVLDSQLQRTVFQFEHIHGVVERIDRDSAQLAAALQGQTARIIITTLQKFPVVMERGVALPDRRYAVIVDEAHSSQGGEAAKDLNRLLGGGESDDDALLAAAEAADADVADGAVSPAQDALAAQVVARGPQPNLSMFAFTATPKGRTLELFGTVNPATERREPFHLYAMKQAIEEGFILDVLANYTTYRTYWHIEKATPDDPQYASRAAKRAIARFVDLHPSNLAQKAEVIVEHFRAHVAHRIGGHAKAMVVTASRLHAVRYARALRAYAAEKGYRLGVLCAFSGTVDDAGVAVTEAQMNGLPESRTAAEFATDAFQVLVVAEKFQTGFDQPLLYAMYVDKTLTGISAVQTLSRLNRTCDGKDGTFVLDFRNEAEDIQAAFDEYHGLTTAAPTDANLLWDTRDALDAWDVLRRGEMDDFAAVLLGDGGGLADTERSSRVQGLLGPAEERFAVLDEDAQEDFRDALGRFVRVYGFVAQIISFGDTRMEADYLFCRHLASKIRRPGGSRLDLSEEVELTHLRQERTFAGAVALTATEGELQTFFGDGSGAQEDLTEGLAAIVGRLNEQFSIGITDQDALVSLAGRVADDLTADAQVQQEALANDLASFSVGKAKVFEDGVIGRMGVESDAALALLNNSELLEALTRELLPGVHAGARVRGQQTAEIGSLLVPGLAGPHLAHLPGIRTGDPALTAGLVPGDALVATVAAMANDRHGGTVLIGVADDGQVTGLEADYATFAGAGPDDFPGVWLALLREQLATRLGEGAAGLVDAEVHTVAGQDLCRVIVRPSPVPVDDRAPAGRVFWHRSRGGALRPVRDEAERDRLVAWRWGG